MVDKLQGVEVALVAAVAFALIGVMVIPSYEDSTGSIDDTLQAASTTTSWNAVINDAQSSNYTVDNDSLTLTGDVGLVQTETVTTDGNYSTFTVNVSNAAADTTVTLYDSTGSQLDSATASGDSTATLSVSDYSSDGFYVEFQAATTTDATVDSFEATGSNPIDSDVDAIIYLVLLLTLVGIGMAMYNRAQ